MCFAALIAIILIIKIIRTAARGDLLNVLWPVSRDIGVRTALGVRLMLSDAQCFGITLLIVIDMFFRCAAFAQLQALWSARLSLDWVHTFSPFLVTLVNFRVYLAGFILMGVGLLITLLLGRAREDRFIPSVKSVSSIVPDSQSTSSGATGASGAFV